MPEIFASCHPTTSSQKMSNRSSLWGDSAGLEKDRIMTSLNLAHDYSDLDEMLDVGDPDDLITGGLQPVSLNVYDDSYIEDLSHLCSENSEITHQHYQSRIDVQKTEDFSQSNEEGLLEALQRSMENFEGSAMSDLAALTSSLGLNLPNSDYSVNASMDDIFSDHLPTVDPSLSSGTGDSTPVYSPEEEETVSVDEQTDLEGDKSDSNESMLKQLLLNPNDNYRKEVDSIKNRKEHLEKAIGNIGNSHASQRQNRKIKKEKMPKKPFTELLKHLESATAGIPQVCTGQSKPKTRIVNAKSYMRQYGSAPASRVNSPEPETAVNPTKKKSLTHKTNSTKNTRNSNIIPKKPLQVTKIYPISHTPVPTLKLDKKNENMIVAPDLNSLLDLFEKEAPNFNTKKDMEVESLTFRPSADKRKSAVLIEPLPKKRSRNSHEESTKKAKNGAEMLSVCYKKPSSDHDYCEKMVQSVPQNGDLDGDSDSKVVQWEQYLQRVRCGTRSAPNSPTTSPKPTRGKARTEKVENPTTINSKPPNVAVIQSSNAPKSKAIGSIKPTIKLQEFQEYLANLQKKQGSKSLPTTPSAEIIAPPSLDQPKTSLKLIQPSSPITVNLSSCKAVLQQTKPITLSQPFIQVKSGGKIHTAAVTSSQTGPHQTAPLVMIRIPTQPSNGGKALVAGSAPQKSLANVAPSTLVFPGGKTITNVSSKSLVSIPISCASFAKMKRMQSVSKSKTPENLNTSQSGEKKNPTFKLMTSSKGKSVILSNVTGQLKDILTALAQQQQQQGYKTPEGSSLTQQKTLQQLLAAITNMKKNNKTTTSNESTAVTTAHTPNPDTSVTVPESASQSPKTNIIPNTNISQATLNQDSAIHIHSDRNKELCSSSLEKVETQHRKSFTGVISRSVSELKNDNSSKTSTNSCQTLNSTIENLFADHTKTLRSPVNPYLKSVVKTTVNSLLDRVVANCSCTAGGVNIHNDVTSTETSSVMRSLTFTENLSANSNQHSMTSTNTGESCTCDDQLYNKLPAYLYSGKLLSKNTDEVQTESDCENIEYNKLPHYFSSGKLAPSEEASFYGSSGNLIDVGMEQEIGFTTEVKCTPEGKVIDPEQTFYSRLPSYYGYGRTHVVDTVTDPPISQCDQLVNEDSLTTHHNENEKPEKHTENQKSSQNERVLEDRIMYSKIPAYLLSGRQPLVRERRWSEMSSLSESSDSEGTTCSSVRRRLKCLRKSSQYDLEKLSKQKDDEQKSQAILQRRVMYVGGINELTSKTYLRSRFQKFGAIDDVTLYFRTGRDNYAFITYRYSNDVIQAIEHGNKNVEPKFTLCFGGRRHFCEVAYADLDVEQSNKNVGENEDDFDTLLQRAMGR